MFLYSFVLKSKNKYLLVVNYQNECEKQTSKEETCVPYHYCGFSTKWHNRPVLFVMCIQLLVILYGRIFLEDEG
jgi:hypothetical protein